MIEIKATEKWYQDAAALEDGLGIKECPVCIGYGKLLLPKTDMACSCYRGKEKIRACHKCHGKGFI